MAKSKTSVGIELIALTPKTPGGGSTLGDPFLETEVGYSKGGMNYFSGTSHPRGYYLYARPIHLEKRDGYTSKSFMLFSGASHFLEAAKAFNAKKLAALADGIKANPAYETLKARVLESGGLTVAEPPAFENPADRSVGTAEDYGGTFGICQRRSVGSSIAPYAALT